MSQKKSTNANVYRLKVTLSGSKPPIWRRLEVRGDTRLSRLHEILQVAMGWTDSHLHQFIVTDKNGGPKYLGVPDPDGWDEGRTVDESKYCLSQIAPGEKSRFLYEYDFGDGWGHAILVEKILSPEPSVIYPRCIKGVRACPPEDCGGLWGYYDLLSILANPSHPEHEERMDWLGAPIDPEHFDLEEVNGLLAQLGRPRRSRMWVKVC